MFSLRKSGTFVPIVVFNGDQMPDLAQPLSNFIAAAVDSTPTYWYVGNAQGERRLPRTVGAEAIARSLMQQLAMEQQYQQEGKMYGVLLVEVKGELRVLKAFSGLLDGQSQIAGWVPPIAGREQVALEEAQTLARLEAIKQELIKLQQIPEYQQHQIIAQHFTTKLQQLRLLHQQRKQERQQQRNYLQQTLNPETLTVIEQLNQQSQQDGIERKRLKQQRDAALKPLQQTLEQAAQRIKYLKQQRKTLSQHLQQQMHAAYRLTNFAGDSLALQDFKRQAQQGLPTGTGECCAPKLLHYAATHQLKPLALAEFWWGRPSGNRRPGAFYAACEERCQPLIGFLLSGLPAADSSMAAQPAALPILYQDDWLIAVNKPAGLLAVPGRTLAHQDSALSQLRLTFSDQLFAVHRLDQDTSGILLLARDCQTHRQLSQQFQQRQIHKVYEAVLTAKLELDAGTIRLPLWADPTNRPRQSVDWQRGKSSLTQFRVLECSDLTRVELVPLTGRTHQLRVHAADSQGLNAPILGDRLYGDRADCGADRLHLHARELHFQHPQTGNVLALQCEVPF